MAERGCQRKRGGRPAGRVGPDIAQPTAGGRTPDAALEMAALLR